MAKRKKSDPPGPSASVRVACPVGRFIQLRYFCPIQRRHVRVSTGTRDEAAAERQRRELEARLTLGIPIQKSEIAAIGPEMAWDDFREQYRVLHLSTVREGTAMHTESRLDVAERILKPRRLIDVADPAVLVMLQAKLLSGEHSRRNKPRSPHTVRGYITSVLAAINWAYLQGWLPAPVKIRKLKVGKSKVMKGRPITLEEFQRMLACTPAVVGVEGAESWHYLLRGLWESALRLNEIMHLSWNFPETIRPVWKSGELPVLLLPASLQKNDTEESIPLLPGLEKLLLETPSVQRTGWTFQPAPLPKFESTAERLGTDWVGKIISRIGKKANVIVAPADERTGRPTKYASSHDLRRSCSERLREAGVPPLVICRILRHESWETTRKHYAPGDVQKDAEVLRQYLTS